MKNLIIESTSSYFVDEDTELFAQNWVYFVDFHQGSTSTMCEHSPIHRLCSTINIRMYAECVDTTMPPKSCWTDLHSDPLFLEYGVYPHSRRLPAGPAGTTLLSFPHSSLVSVCLSVYWVEHNCSAWLLKKQWERDKKHHCKSTWDYCKKLDK